VGEMSKYNGPTYVLNLPMYSNYVDIIKIENIFDISRTIYNYMLRETLKRYNSMSESKKYRKNLRCIKAVLKKIKKLNQEIEATKDKKVLNVLKKDLKHLNNELSKLNKEQNDIKMEFGYNEYVLHEVVAIPKNYFNRIDINTAQKLATRAFKAVEKMRSGKAKRVNFIKYKGLDSIEGKDNKSGIKFRLGKNQYVVKFQGMTIPVKVPQNDKYAFLALSDLSKISYCRIVRKIIRGKIRFFLQLTIKGLPPEKKNRKLGNGIASIDPSLQMMAVYSDVKAMLAELAPNIQNLEDEIRITRRKLERSTRELNPNKFNPDGTPKKGDKTPWVRSKSYFETLFKLKELYRKQAAIKKLMHNRLSNIFLRFGDVFIIEKNNFKAFQKRSKKTKKNKKTGRLCSKKRFGKSIANKAPSMFLTILKNKVKYLGGRIVEVDPRKAKPSQYCHVTNSYVKKPLKQHWHIFPDRTSVQRDLYTAFLLSNIDEKTGLIDRNECIKNFSKFKKLHEVEIERVKKQKSKISAFGI
jgi:hypothetical protein